jgi:hypothetical protein
MVSLVSIPPPIVLSGMPAWFKVQTVANLGVVTATIKHGSQVIGVEKSHVDVNGLVVFELSEYFHNNLQPSP